MAKRMAFLGGMLLVTLLAACNGGGEEPQSTPSPSPAVTLPSPTPEPTPRAGEPSIRQLAYVGAGGAIWLVNADGSGLRRLTEDCTRPMLLAWSPGGDKIMCAGGSAEAVVTPGSPITPNTRIFDVEGKLLTSFRADATSFTWSPDGHRYAYTVTADGDPGQTDLFVDDADNLSSGFSIAYAESHTWSPDGRLAAYRPLQAAIGPVDPTAFLDVYTGAEARAIPGDYRPLAWVLSGTALLVAAKYQPSESLAGPSYKANLLDLVTEQVRRVPELDNGVPFWLSPAGEKAAFLGGKPMQGEGGPEIAIIDLATLAVTPIPESTIGYPSEFIPSRHVAFSGDGSTIYWADVRLPPTDIYRATTDGGEPTKLASLANAFGVEFSSDRMQIAYIVGGNPPILWIANIDGSGSNEIGPMLNAFAWRPTP